MSTSYTITVGKVKYTVVNDGFVYSNVFSELLNDPNRTETVQNIAKDVVEALENWVEEKKDGIAKGKEIKGNLAKVFDNKDFKDLAKRYAKLDQREVAFTTKNKLLNNLGEYGIEKGFEVNKKNIKVFFTSYDFWNYNSFKKSITVKENIEYFKSFNKKTKAFKNKEKEFDIIEQLAKGE